MPEGLEAEIYRRAVVATIGRRIIAVEIDERQDMAVEIGSALPGTTISAIRRRGKMLAIETVHFDGVDGPVLGLHFGMTGRLIIDGEAPIDRLEYASGRDDPAWNRLILELEGGGTVRVNDPRRWARFTLDPDLDRLGPDFLDVSASAYAAAFAGRSTSVKAVLLDQTRIAGFGNLCVDEVLWHAGIAPGRSVRSLDEEAVECLARVAREQLPAMLDRGGSHRGTIDPETRATLPPCPRDGAPLRKATIAGRTTVWCPSHQSD